MSGDTAAAIPKAGRNKNNNSAKKKKNKNQTMNLDTGNVQVGEGAEPGPWEYPLGTSDSAMVVPVHTPLKQTKSKKRNNSVSAMEQVDGVAPKKTKLDDTPVPQQHDSRIFRNSRMKKHKKNRVFKDHIDDEDMEATPTTSPSVVTLKKCKAEKAKPKTDEDMQSNEAEPVETKTDVTNNNQSKKQRKRKRQRKHAKMDTDEPNLKIQKQSTPEEELTEVLENMQIDTKPSNLSDLVDEMVPAGPEPCKPKCENDSRKENTNTDCNSNEFDLKKVVEWTKKNWNKDRLTATTIENQNSSVLIENLPVIMSSVYRKKLMAVFQKYGQIKHIGPTEVQQIDEEDATFNTTICFESEEAAIKLWSLDQEQYIATWLSQLPSQLKEQPTPQQVLSLQKEQPTPQQVQSSQKEKEPLQANSS